MSQSSPNSTPECPTSGGRLLLVWKSKNCEYYIGITLVTRGGQEVIVTYQNLWEELVQLLLLAIKRVLPQFPLECSCRHFVEENSAIGNIISNISAHVICKIIFSFFFMRN